MGALSSARLDPVYFKPGKSHLTEDMQNYLDQVAQLMEEHPKIEMFLCSVSTAADQKRFSNEDRLHKLADKRAVEVKDYLVEKAGIDLDRLVLCLPRIDLSIDAPGHVDLQI